jgi:hypothetical protein
MEPAVPPLTPVAEAAFRETRALALLALVTSAEFAQLPEKEQRVADHPP